MSGLRWLVVLLLGTACAAQELTVAAASDLLVALPEIAAAYEAKTGRKVRLVFGSSGSFLAQIQNGAPYDVFFSADVEYPRRLEQSGLAVAGSRYIYATGRLALWAPKGSPLAVEKGLAALRDSAVQRIAIANPAHAPYGRAAQTALQKAGLWEIVKGKLVLGENISQAAQFVETGNAQAGIIALSLALSPRMTAGKRWIIPPDLCPPLEQAVVILKRGESSTAAKDFVDFVKSAPGRHILEHYGLAPPVAR